MHSILTDIVSVEWITYIASFGLILIGLFIVFTDKNLIKIIIGLDMAIQIQEDFLLQKGLVAQTIILQIV